MQDFLEPFHKTSDLHTGYVKGGVCAFALWVQQTLSDVNDVWLSFVYLTSALFLEFFILYFAHLRSIEIVL